MAEWKLSGKSFEDIKTLILGATEKLKDVKERESLGTALFNDLLGKNADDAMKAFFNIGKNGKLLTKKSSIKEKGKPIPLEDMPISSFKYPMARQLHQDSDLLESLATIYPYLNIAVIIRAIAMTTWLKAKARKKRLADKDIPEYAKREAVSILFYNNQCKKEEQQKVKPKEEGAKEDRYIETEISEATKKTVEKLQEEVETRIEQAKDNRQAKRVENKASRKKDVGLTDLEANITNPWELFQGLRADKFSEYVSDKRQVIPESKLDALCEEIDNIQQLIREDWIGDYDWLRGCIRRMKG